MSRTHTEIQSDVDALEEFSRGYKMYFGVADDDGTVPVVASKGPLRDRLHRQLPRVERIMRRAGTDGFGFGPPPIARGTPPRMGIVACAFADEDPVYAVGGGPLVSETVLDRIAMTFGVLDEELAGTSSAPNSEESQPAIQAASDGASREPVLTRNEGGPLRIFVHGVAAAFVEARAAWRRRQKPRFPKLILQRVLRSAPSWAVVIERFAIFLERSPRLLSRSWR